MTHCDHTPRILHILELMCRALTRMEEHMADFSAVNAKLIDIDTSMNALAAKVDELKAAAGAGDQQAEVDAVRDALDALKARIDALVA